MQMNLRSLLCLCMVGLWLPSLQAQYFEDTWQEFLKNSKASGISELPMPNPKENPKDYAKYCLMYATDHFCSSDVKGAEGKMSEIRGIDPTVRTSIPGFDDRHKDLGSKIAAYHKLDEIWRNFLLSRTLVNMTVPEVEVAKKVCEKGTLAKVWYLESQVAYCKGDVATAKDHFENKVVKLLEGTSFKADRIEGMPKEMAMMKELFAGLTRLDAAWKQYTSTDKSPGFDTDLPFMACYSIPTMKVYMLRAAVDVCKTGSEMLKKIKELMKTNTHPIPGDLQAKIDWLESMVGTSDADVAKLNAAWKAFLPQEKLTTPMEFPFDYPCDRAAQVKAYIIDGMTNICEDGKGKQRLADIAKTREQYNPTLDAETLAKLKSLEDKVKKYEQESAELEKAWQAFIVKDTLTTPMKFVYDYPCDRAAQIKAYLITGLSDVCGKGREMLNNIEKTQKLYSPELAEEVTSRIEKLTAKVTERERDLADLNAAWKQFTPQDTITGSYRLVDFYCDKIAQVKSWVIKGHLDACGAGQGFVKRIDEFQKKNSLTFDNELACRITRLRIKVWDCRYWELVRQARRETHEERERFGPESANIMQMELNSKQQPCSTKVMYTPVGYIGIKYVIITYLCQDMDLAKMGDPLYYKKIADWVEFKVLQRYCEANMRCKEDFFIYLEGHTDGNNFSGANYKESLAIPMGQPFTHFIGKDTLQKKTDREITTSLKNNMELGIARAWTVKKQLDFMNVPIRIGAYEHPASEKGGEFRRIEIELNINNLLLDFYEKRLKQLLIESGIGERPKPC